jgi:hypothetical protein
VFCEISFFYAHPMPSLPRLVHRACLAPIADREVCLPSLAKRCAKPSAAATRWTAATSRGGKRRPTRRERAQRRRRSSRASGAAQVRLCAEALKGGRVHPPPPPGVRTGLSDVGFFCYLFPLIYVYISARNGRLRGRLQPTAV